MGARSWSFGIGLMVAVGMIVGRSESVAEVTAAPSVPKGMAEASTCQSRADCGSPVKGGLQITYTGWSCTTGFVARDTEAGTLVLLTAGHCLAGSGLLALWSHHGTTIGRASVEAFQAGSNADIGAIEVAEPEAGNEVYGSSSTDIRRVTGWASNASQTVGSKVCRSGGTSGWGCGTIVVADVDATIDGRLIHHTWWTDFPSAAGDSGSPVLNGDGRAAGIVIATTPTHSLYSTVDWIATELHARPCVTPSCD